MLDDVAQTLRAQSGDIARAAGVDVTARVAVGDVLSEILSGCNGADLLAVGAHGLNWARDMILGTTAERLLGKCRSPILVVRRPAARAYERVIVAVDFSSYSKNALKMAMAIAPQAAITTVHAFEVPFEGQLRRAGITEADIQSCRYEARLRAVDAIRALASEAADARITHVVEHGSAARLILTQEDALNAELIVIGKHGRTRTEEWLLGSVTRHILADSTCDVLVVQKGAEAV
ncbi:MAG: universal stress protein [Sulfurifustaceae bacterium]